MPREWARSLPRTLSMSQRMIPSTSAAVRPASASAASDAWVARLRSVLPEFFEKSVAPMPTMAQRSRWWSSGVDIRPASQPIEDVGAAEEDGRGHAGGGDGGHDQGDGGDQRV